MGCGSNTSTTTSGPPPQVTQAYQNLIGQANTVAGQPLQQYTGPLVAGFTPDQYAAMGTIDYAQGMSQPYTNQAASYMQSAAQPITPMSFSSDAVNSLMSPYTQDVVNQTQAEFNNQNAQAQAQLQGNATSAGAYGGDRASVAQGIQSGQESLAQAPVIANLYNTGYGTALGEFNALNQAQIGAQEATGWLQQGAGYGMGNLGQSAENQAIAGANAQYGSGAAQQALAQNELNIPYEEFQAQQAYPFQTTGWLGNLVEGIGSASGGISSTTTPGPSAISQLGGLGLAGAGLYGATGGFGGLFGSSGGDYAGSLGGALSNVSQDASNFAADITPHRGGRIPPKGYAGGGGLPMMPSFGAGVPDVSINFVPMGPAAGAGGGNRMGLSPMQPVTTQTQSSDPGIMGILGPIASIAKIAAPFLVKDGGRIPGFAAGGSSSSAVPSTVGGSAVAPVIHSAAPVMSLPQAAPSSYTQVSPGDVSPVANFAPTFSPQGYPTAMIPVGTGYSTTPLSIPLSGGVLNRPNPSAAPALTTTSPANNVTVTLDPTLDASLGQQISTFSGGGWRGGNPMHFADGGPANDTLPPDIQGDTLGMHVYGASPQGGSWRYQSGSTVGGHLGRDPFVQPGIPANERRIGGGVFHRDSGGSIPDLSISYIPKTAFGGSGRNTIPAPPRPVEEQNPIQQVGGLTSGISGIEKLFKSDSSSSSGDDHALGGSVGDDSAFRGYDYGGSVEATGQAMSGGMSPNTQQYIQQYLQLPVEKLQELAMRAQSTGGAGGGQAQVIQRALQIKQANPSAGATAQQTGLGVAAPTMTGQAPTAPALTTQSPFGAPLSGLSPGLAWRGGRQGFDAGGMPQDVPQDFLGTLPTDNTPPDNAPVSPDVGGAALVAGTGSNTTGNGWGELGQALPKALRDIGEHGSPIKQEYQAPFMPKPTAGFDGNNGPAAPQATPAAPVKTTPPASDTGSLGTVEGAPVVSADEANVGTLVPTRTPQIQNAGPPPPVPGVKEAPLPGVSTEAPQPRSHPVSYGEHNAAPPNDDLTGTSGAMNPAGGVWIGTGDSIARGYVQNSNHAVWGSTALDRNDQNYNNVDAAAGRSPEEVYKYITSRPWGYYAGKPVLLSTGISNNPDQIGYVPWQLQALKDAGASRVFVVGVGTKAGTEPGSEYRDLAKYNPMLAQMAQAKSDTNTDIQFGGALPQGTIVHPALTYYGSHLPPGASNNVAAAPRETAGFGSSEPTPTAATAPQGGGRRYGGDFGPLAPQVVDYMRGHGKSNEFIAAALGEAISEGGLSDPWHGSGIRLAGGGYEQSFGPWQLHKGADLDVYQRAEGANDPHNIQHQMDFLMRRAEEIEPGITTSHDAGHIMDVLNNKFEVYQGHGPGQRRDALAAAQRYLAGDINATTAGAGAGAGSSNGAQAPAGAGEGGGGNNIAGFAPASNQPTAEGRGRDRGVGTSPWLPLIAAGLGMMASRSHFPGVAIGEGGLAGVKTAEEQEQLSNKREIADAQLAVRQQAIQQQAALLAERIQFLDYKISTGAASAAERAEKDRAVNELGIAKFNLAEAEFGLKGAGQWYNTGQFTEDHYPVMINRTTGEMRKGTIPIVPKTAGNQAIIDELIRNDPSNDPWNTKAQRALNTFKDPNGNARAQVHVAMQNAAARQAQAEAKASTDPDFDVNGRTQQLLHAMEAEAGIGVAPATTARTGAAPQGTVQDSTPATATSTNIPPGWKYSGKVNAQGQPVYLDENNVAHAMVQ